MFISQAAITVGELLVERGARWLGRRRISADDDQRDPLLAVSATILDDPDLAPAPEAIASAQVEPVPMSQSVRPAPLTRDEQRARKAAVRGLRFARALRYQEAEEAFAEAARRDPSLDLARVPSFWSLPHGGQLAAVRAYEHAGRTRDAAALAATIRYTFRLRPLPMRAELAD